MKSRQPIVVLIGRPNGAGKSTSVVSLVQRRLGIEQFVNADAIALGLSPFAPESVALSAGKVMIQRLHDLMRRREDFAFESTLASTAPARILKEAREQRYSVNVVDVWLRSVALAIGRVDLRVAEGGHAVARERRRAHHVAPRDGRPHRPRGRLRAGHRHHAPHRPPGRAVLRALRRAADADHVSPAVSARGHRHDDQRPRRLRAGRALHHRVHVAVECLRQSGDVGATRLVGGRAAARGAVRQASSPNAHRGWNTS